MAHLKHIEVSTYFLRNFIMRKVKSTRQILASALLSIVLLAVVGSANANLIVEFGDAGELLTTAQSVGNNTTQITGSAGSSDVDMYNFSWGGGALTIDTFGSTFDTDLYLFDSTGLGIAENDDFGSLQSQLSFANLLSGDFFIAIANCCQDPISAGGLIFPNDCCSGQSGPTGPGGGQVLTGWASSSAGGSLLYEINFSSAVSAPTGVPEPSTLVLLGLALAGIRIFKKKKIS